MESKLFETVTIFVYLPKSHRFTAVLANMNSVGSGHANVESRTLLQR